MHVSENKIVKCLCMDEILNRYKNINRGYRQLEVWKEAIELFVFVKKKIQTIISISFKTKAQIEDSALSCSSNIAEGYCRRSLKENINFVNYALASLGENYTRLFALLKSADIDKEWFDEYDKKLFSLENKLIQFNKSMIAKLDSNDWHSDYTIREAIEHYNADSK